MYSKENIQLTPPRRCSDCSLGGMAGDARLELPHGLDEVPCLESQNFPDMPEPDCRGTSFAAMPNTG